MKIKAGWPLTAAAAAWLAGGFIPATVSAQEGAAALEEVIVTARKREEALSDVPLSISAFDADFIENSGVNGIFELAQFTPGLSYRQSYGRTFDRPAIRGQSIVLGENTVGLFVDGVFVQGSLSSTPLDNIERVEVIRGPQAALFGRATLAGAINYVTRKPGNVWTGKVSGTAAEHDEYEIRGYISGPIVEDVLAFDLGARHYEYDGEYKNIGPGGGDIGQEETNGGYGSLYWTPTENFNALARVTYFEDDDGHPTNWLEIQSDELNCFLTVARGYYCGEVKASDNVAIDILADPGGEIRNTYGIERETLRTSLELNWDVGLFTATSVTAYSEEEEHWLIDTGPQVNPIFFSTSITEIDTEWEYWSQELRLTSSADQPLRWLVGGYYYDSEESDPTSVSKTEIENIAVFGSLEYDFIENLTGSVELRWAEDEITDTGSLGVLDDTFDSTTPRFTLRWAQSETAQIYGSVALGTKPGGFNSGLLDSDVPPDEQARLSNFTSYDEEEAWNFELGTKRQLFDGRVYLELAAFFITWEDQQLTTTEAFTNSDGEPDSIPLITNLGETEIWGVELTTNWAITDELTANLAYGYTDVEIQEACDAEWGAFTGVDPECETQLGVPGGGSLEGNSTPNAPEHTLAVSLDYARPINADLEWFARGDYLFESERYAQVFNLASTGDSSRINLRTGVASQNWKLSAWVKNLTDDDTVDAVVRLVDFNTFFARRAFQAHLPRGRQFGVTFEYNFGGE
jgi:outer membrane receptor protein involved in Fe transport